MLKNHEQISVSFFDNLKNVIPISTIKLQIIFKLIKEGKWKLEIERVRNNPEYKKELPCFTPSGTFMKRNSLGIKEYSGIICLDLDNLASPESLKQFCKSLSWVWVAFITPSGKGLKVFVITKPVLSNFKLTEEKVALAFFEATGVIRDVRCKDLARLQFVSNDEFLYENTKPENFE